jgi:hypothetical protein
MRRLRAPLVACALGATALLAACGGPLDRTNTRTINESTSRAFKRAYDAAHRMSSDRAVEKLVEVAYTRCRPLGAPPRGAAPWRWACSVDYETHLGAGARVAYVVGVDPRGCFTATTGDFPPRLYERVLGRFSPNPLARFRSCP